MIRIWLIAGMALLAGCESEFERCMRTELPIAYEAVDMEDELAAGEALESLARYLDDVKISEPADREWLVNNPSPDPTLSKDYEVARVAWRKKRSAETFRITEAFSESQ